MSPSSVIGAVGRGRHRRRAALAAGSDGAQPQLLAGGRRTAVPGQVPVDRRRLPPEPVGAGVQLREPRALPHHPGDHLGRDDAADARPVRVLPAVERALAVEAVLEEALREVQHVDSLAPEQPVERPVVRVEAGDGNGYHRVLHADLVGVDDRLGRHGHDEQLDAARRQLPVEAQDHGERIEGVERPAGQVAELGDGEDPALPPGHRGRAARLRVRGELPVGGAEIDREVVRDAMPAARREEEDAGQGQRGQTSGRGGAGAAPGGPAGCAGRPAADGAVRSSTLSPFGTPNAP